MEEEVICPMLNDLARNCASSHLCRALWMMLDAMVVGNAVFATMAMDPHSLLSTDNLGELAVPILNRLLEGSDTMQGMDRHLYPQASRDLANAMLILIEEIIVLARGDGGAAAIMMPMASLLARAVAHSSIGDDKIDVEAPLRQERTAVLASALSLLLQSTTTQSSSLALLAQYEEDFLMAARALVSLAEFDVAGDDSKAAVATLARSSLQVLVQTCGDSFRQRLSAVAPAALSKDLLQSATTTLEALPPTSSHDSR